MKNRFDNAINALVKAFLGDTLAKYNCAMCAVGNIVAYSNNIKVIPTIGPQYWYDVDQAKWSLFVGAKNAEEAESYNSIQEAFSNRNKDWQASSKIPLKMDFQKGFRLIKNTGYSVEELCEIERIFEYSTDIPYDKYCFHSKEKIMEDQYKGLMAVVELLCELENKSEQEELETKQLFAYYS